MKMQSYFVLRYVAQCGSSILMFFVLTDINDILHILILWPSFLSLCFFFVFSQFFFFLWGFLVFKANIEFYIIRLNSTFT